MFTLIRFPLLCHTVPPPSCYFCRVYQTLVAVCAQESGWAMSLLLLLLSRQLFLLFIFLNVKKFCSILLPCCTFVSCPRPPGRLKVREAAGVFFVIVGDGKNRLLKLIVAKLLKRHRSCDRRKDRDVCREAAAAAQLQSRNEQEKMI